MPYILLKGNTYEKRIPEEENDEEIKLLETGLLFSIVSIKCMTK
jgi:hypothetical protein